jgi:hypothetical protein
MLRGKLLTLGCIATLDLVALVASIAIAEPSKDTKAAAGQPEMKLPPGWTEADMKAVMEAGTPGKMHAQLAKSVGTWQGKSSMWMAPGGGEPMVSECTSTVSPMMDGRFFKCEMNGEMPGMGPYNGLGIYGYDNVAGKFVSSWIDNHGTGMMNGDGELSADGKTITWNYTYNCPITKKPAIMREVETTEGNSKTLEMFGADPKTGKEFKMMRIELTKK